MSNDPIRSCPDCDDSLDRRRFLQTVGGVAAAATAAPLLTSVASAAPTQNSAAETAVKALYETLSDKQALGVCLPFNHKLRSRVNANWHISRARINKDFLTSDQLDLVDQILKGITSEGGYELLQKQMQADARNGLADYSFAIFGEPGKGKSEFELTGRHLTLRADGDSVKGAAFGGPIVYGHGVGNPERNLFYHQTKQVNEVFKALDPKQAEKALVEDSPSEDEVALQGKDGDFPGIAVSDLSSDQKDLVTATLKTLLSPYREEDVDEVMHILKAGGGQDSLRMSYYADSDLKDDKIWDVWRIEGPSFVWHFRGDPHVHAYINIGLPGKQA